MKNLQVLANQIIYRAVPTQPLFGLLRDPEIALKTIYDEFKSLNIKVADLRYDVSSPVQDRHVGVVFGIGYCKVMVERVEANFSEFNQRQIGEIAKAFDATLSTARRLTEAVIFQSHQLTYYGHAKIEHETYSEFSKKFPVPVIKSPGEILSTGVTYNFREPTKGWKFHLSMDASVAFPDALFLSWTIDLLGDELNTVSIGPELQAYLAAVLGEFDLQFAEDQNAGT